MATDDPSATASLPHAAMRAGLAVGELINLNQQLVEQLAWLRTQLHTLLREDAYVPGSAMSDESLIEVLRAALAALAARLRAEDEASR
jgi:hypothetical protein